MAGKCTCVFAAKTEDDLRDFPRAGAHGRDALAESRHAVSQLATHRQARLRSMLGTEFGADDVGIGALLGAPRSGNMTLARESG